MNSFLFSQVLIRLVRLQAGAVILFLSISIMLVQDGPTAVQMHQTWNLESLHIF